MKIKHLIFLSLLTMSYTSYAQEEIFALPETPQKPIPEQEIFDGCEPEAQYRGGKSAMLTFIHDNMNYPERALKDSIQGRCWLRFVVKSDGSIGKITITRKVENCPECDAEAIRVIRSMPKWIPAEIQGKPVNSYFDLPINFRMQ